MNMNKIVNLIVALLIVILGSVTIAIAFLFISVMMESFSAVAVVLSIAFFTCIYIVYRWLEETK